MGIKHSETIGHKPTKEYRAWMNMRFRCRDKVGKNSATYAGRGIEVCARWNHKNSFPLFLEDMGRAPTETHSIDRIDNNKGYFPENCRWATKREQVLNRSVALTFELDGQTFDTRSLAAYTGIPYATIVWRYYKGLPFEKVISKTKLNKKVHLSKEPEVF